MAEQMNQGLNYEDYEDFYDAAKGFLGELEESIIKEGGQGQPGAIIWDINRYRELLGEPLRYTPGESKEQDAKNRADFEKRIRTQLGKCPASVNKSLWRQALLNHMHGLFEVRKGVYQVRGYDLANMTIVEISRYNKERPAYVVIDCTTDEETAVAALKLFERIKGAYFISKIILTHSHVDHYGGVRGVARMGNNPNIKIVAPEHFLEEAALENAIAGDAMARRSTYQYGTLLQVPQDGSGKIDAGLGKDIQSGGTVGFQAPDISVVPNPEGKKFDNIVKDTTVIHEKAHVGFGSKAFEFLLCPNTEAPAEMVIYIPGDRLLVAAEVATHTLHNLLTPRGAEVRDARLWWKALDEILERYGNDMDCIVATHHWPVWRRDRDGKYTNRCRTFLEQQRDSYKYLHDQTVRLMNHGYTMLEIADWFDRPGHLPGFLREQWHNRGYYGTISHDVRAIYQKYLGWYDMNPSNLNPLPPEASARRYIEAMGAERVYQILADALAETDTGKRTESLRWAAEVGRHLVLARCKAGSGSDSHTQKDYRDRLAEVYEALGQQCEAGTWRNMYLVGAAELRQGGPLGSPSLTSVNLDILNAMDDELFYDYLAGRWNAEKAMDTGCAGERGVPWSRTFLVEEEKEDKTSVTVVFVSDGVLNYHPGSEKEPDGIRFRLSRDTFSKLVTGREDFDKAWEKGEISGKDIDRSEIKRLFETFDKTLPDFEIVLPKGR